MHGFLSLFFRFFGHLHLSRSSCGVGDGCGNVSTPGLSDVKEPGGLNVCVVVVGSGGATKEPGRDQGSDGVSQVSGFNLGMPTGAGAGAGVLEGDDAGEGTGEGDGRGDDEVDGRGSATGRAPGLTGSVLGCGVGWGMGAGPRVLAAPVRLVHPAAPGRGRVAAEPTRLRVTAARRLSSSSRWYCRMSR